MVMAKSFYPITPVVMLITALLGASGVTLMLLIGQADLLTNWAFDWLNAKLQRQGGSVGNAKFDPASFQAREWTKSALVVCLLAYPDTGINKFICFLNFTTLLNCEDCKGWANLWHTEQQAKFFRYAGDKVGR